MATNTILLHERSSDLLQEKLAIAVRDIEVSGGEVKSISYQSTGDPSQVLSHSALVLYDAPAHETAAQAELSIARRLIREEAKKNRRAEYRALFEKFQTAFGKRTHVAQLTDEYLLARGFTPTEIKSLTDVFVASEFNIESQEYRFTG